MIEDNDGEPLAEEVESKVEEITAADREIEEPIPLDEKPAKKKIALLKARHELEDYFEMKKLREALDYLFEDEEDKAKK